MNAKTYTLKIAAAAFAVTAVLLFCLCEVPPTGGGNGGGGDTVKHLPDTAWYADNPGAAAFNISTADELAGLALLVNREDSPVDFAGKTIKLTADIDLSARYGRSYNEGIGWIAIGMFTGSINRPFKGGFDGDGRVIRGLYVSGNRIHRVAGLFGRIDGGAVVRNVRLTGVSVAGGYCLGGVAGSAVGGSKVLDCYVEGAIDGNRDIGGVVGEIFGGEVSGCRFAGTVNAQWGVGGVIGSVSGVKVSNCYALGGTVSGDMEVGGVVGSVNETSGTGVYNCYSTASVSSLSGGAGGVVGYVYRNATITNCAALNKSVKDAGDTRIAGRIVGHYDPDDGTALSGNIAFSGMEGGAPWGNIGAGNIDGADITKEAINSDGTLGGRFKAADGWTIQNGKLPGLGGQAVEMPEHLR